MKTLYIECNMGAAGDMLTAALLELHPNPEDFLNRLNSLNIPNVKIVREIGKKCGITGSHIRVMVGGVEEDEDIYDHHHERHHHEHHYEHNHDHHHEHHYEHNHEHHHEHSHHEHHHHSSLSDIEHIVSHLNLPQKVYEDVISIYRLIAEAESVAHNTTIDNIHFHEVGTMDAIADITAAAMLINEIAPDKIIASPINTGKGQVKCAHGILPVPAPATAYILRGVPVYSNNVEGELCTPTGAAILKHFVTEFKSMPTMKINKIGYGLGTKDFETANCLRAYIGETEDTMDRVVELICSIDDMSGERMGFAVNQLINNGALDVYTTPIYMKKNRPGILLTCICREDKREDMLRLVFKYTTTIGIRENVSNRYVLNRSQKVVATKYGDVNVKKSWGYGVEKTKAEYKDLEKIALENNIDISEIEL